MAGPLERCGREASYASSYPEMGVGGNREAYNLKPAVVNYTGDARHQWRRRSNILQAIDNEADSVELATPQGKKNEKN